MPISIKFLAGLSLGALAWSAQSYPVTAITLDFTNFSGQPDDGVGVIYSNVGVDEGTALDLIVSAVGPYDAETVILSNLVNGAINIGPSSDGAIGVGGAGSGRLKFQFVEAGTSTPFTTSSFSLGFPNFEEGIFFSPLTYTLAADSTIAVDTPTPDSIRFRQNGGVSGVLNDSRNLTAEQEQAAVIVEFVNTSSFELRAEGGSGLTLFFDDDLLFDDAVPVTTATFTPVPESLPAASSIVLFATGLLLRRRQKRLNQSRS